MNLVDAAQRVIHAKRDRRADRNEAEDRETDEFLAALGAVRPPGENADAHRQQPPSGRA
jgi:hypothetical protein